MIWTPTPSGFMTTRGPTMISVDYAYDHNHTYRVWRFYASTPIDAMNSRVYVSPMFYDTPDAAQAGAEKWIEKQQ